MENFKRHYLTAKVSTELYQLNPQYLNSEQKAHVKLQVEQIADLQSAILASDEAQHETLTEGDLDVALQSCIEAYDDEEAFYQALSKQNMSIDELKLALSDELICDKVLNNVSQSVPPLDRDKAYQYYVKNRLQFSRTRTWELSQILITVNEDFAENSKASALKRITDIRKELSPQKFAKFALKYSECPTALQDGYLGWCEESKLYPAIVDALYSTKLGQISEPIETELGYHLVMHHSQREPKTATFEEVLPFLENKHHDRAKKYLQKQWLSQLLATKKNN